MFLFVRMYGCAYAMRTAESYWFFFIALEPTPKNARDVRSESESQWTNGQEKVSCLKAVAPLSEDFVKRCIVLFLPHVCLQQLN